MKQKSAYINNIKAILIFTVVIGHMVSCVKSIDLLGEIIYSFFYAFHMPAFLFITGYLSKGVISDPKKMIRRELSFISIYIIYQIIFDFVQRYLIDSVNSPFTFLEPRIGLWFLLVLIIWIPVCFLLKNQNKIILLCLSLIGGLAIGFYADAGKELALSRLFVFLPFFLAGLYITKESFMCFEGKTNTLLYKIGSIVALIVTIPYVVETSNSLFLGAKSYQDMGFGLLEGSIERSIWYFVASIMMLCFFVLVPRKKYIFTYLGERTLSIFLLHSIICRIFFVEKMLYPLYDSTGLLGIIGAAIGLTILLGIKPLQVLVTIPDKYIQQIPYLKENNK